MPTLALISWPIISLIFFVALGPARGLIWAVVVGYLFLPESFGFDIPGLPPYDKNTAISLGLLIPALFYWGKVEKTPSADPFFRHFVLLCFAALFLGAFGTYLRNPETLVNGPVVRSGLSPRDVISIISDNVLRLTPFVLAWRFLRNPEHHRELLLAMVVMGVGYTFLVLFELRMSPQLNKWIYGYFPHNWRQHLRGDGFRPLVFLRHGLWLGFFLFSVAMAAMALSRDKTFSRPLMIMVGIWCFIVLVLSRNLGATMLAILFVPAVLLFSFRAQVRLASVLAIILLSYPILSSASLTPATRLLEIISPIAPERAQSFKFRLDNENLLITRGMEKPAFGWGGYSRQRVFDDRGRDQTLTDGLWIIVLGQGGWVKYLAFFGILCAPVLFLRRAARRKEISAPIAGMAMIMGGNFVYMIPNSTFSPLAVIMLGAMAAFVQYDTAQDKTTPGPDPAGPDRQVRYSRFTKSDASAATSVSLSRRTASSSR